MSEGYIKLHRSIQDHWLWKDEPYDKARAWIDLILLANHEDVRTSYKGEVITCERGTVNRSISNLSDRWKWSRDKTRRFLTLLESDGMVVVNATTNRTTITLVNYDNFQVSPTTDKATNRQRVSQRVDTNNNDKNDKNKEIYPYGYTKKAETFIELPLNDGTNYEVSVDDIKQFKELYPATDVEQQLRSMKGWLIGNPTKKKTRKGINRFITNWLSREQNKGGVSNGRYGSREPDIDTSPGAYSGLDCN